MCNYFPGELTFRGINVDQLSIVGNNRSDAKEYLKRGQIQYHPDMKLPTLIGTNFEESHLDFTSLFRRQNALIRIPLDYLLRPHAIGNYDAAWISLSKS